MITRTFLTLKKNPFLTHLPLLFLQQHSSWYNGQHSFYLVSIHRHMSQGPSQTEIIKRSGHRSRKHNKKTVHKEKRREKYTVTETWCVTGCSNVGLVSTKCSGTRPSKEKEWEEFSLNICFKHLITYTQLTISLSRGYNMVTSLIWM